MDYTHEFNTFDTAYDTTSNSSTLSPPPTTSLSPTASPTHSEDFAWEDYIDWSALTGLKPPQVDHSLDQLIFSPTHQTNVEEDNEMFYSSSGELSSPDSNYCFSHGNYGDESTPSSEAEGELEGDTSL